ncbi:hypothetical protein QTG54_007528 [Skeletonema marinoi]|uniref:Uncharacterized protein n=1 Tax=Skeletonema marinoi TaxID=267567 RepID=A0AAD8YAD2_9STRA|nr:hypothetical protein QTG54_007528 [Skeletonema marinoi]
MSLPCARLLQKLAQKINSKMSINDCGRRHRFRHIIIQLAWQCVSLAAAVGRLLVRLLVRWVSIL